MTKTIFIEISWIVCKITIIIILKIITFPIIK